MGCKFCKNDQLQNVSDQETTVEDKILPQQLIPQEQQQLYIINSTPNQFIQQDALIGAQQQQIAYSPSYHQQQYQPYTNAQQFQNQLSQVQQITQSPSFKSVSKKKSHHRSKSNASIQFTFQQPQQQQQSIQSHLQQQIQPANPTNNINIQSFLANNQQIQKQSPITQKKKKSNKKVIPQQQVLHTETQPQYQQSYLTQPQKLLIQPQQPSISIEQKNQSYSHKSHSYKQKHSNKQSKQSYTNQQPYIQQQSYTQQISHIQPQQQQIQPIINQQGSYHIGQIQQQPITTVTQPIQVQDQLNQMQTNIIKNIEEIQFDQKNIDQAYHQLAHEEIKDSGLFRSRHMEKSYQKKVDEEIQKSLSDQKYKNAGIMSSRINYVSSNLPSTNVPVFPKKQNDDQQTAVTRLKIKK